MYPYDNNYGGYNNQQQPQYNMYQQQPNQQQQQQRVQEAPPVTIKDEGIGLNFNYLTSDKAQLPVESSFITDTVDTKKKRKPAAKKSGIDVVMKDGSVVNTEDGNVVESVVYADTYQETNNLLKGVIAQIDMVGAEVKQDMDLIRASKTLKGKYTYLSNMTGNFGALMSSKIGAIKEINSSIKNINDAEYRRYKDNRAMEQGNDDKYIQDMFNAFISTKPTTASQFIAPPSTLDMTTGGLQMIPANMLNSSDDPGFQQYLANLTPEQNAMINEGNPDIKEYVVHDLANDNRYFQWRNDKTGEPVPNMPATDPMFLADVKIDDVRKVATNINMNRTWPVITLNEKMYAEY